MITEFWPYPEHSGASQRAATAVEALTSLGSVDLFHIDRGWGTAVPWLDPPPGVARWHRAALPEPGGAARLARQLRRPGLPRDLASLAGRLGPALAAWCRGHEYDLVWCAKETAWVTVRDGAPPAPVVIDVDDLYEVTWARKKTLTERWWPRRVLDGIDLAHLRWSWHRAHRRHSAEADTLLLCSEVDQGRLAALGADNTVVVPNTYRGEVLRPVADERARPAIIFQAAFGYFPNHDAARILADQILPAVRQHVPETLLYLVGHHGGGLDDLSRRADVVVTGEVDEMTPWLTRAQVCAVPIRAGSGTRTKILEAVAHGVPVVSSRIGIEGLHLVDGEHAFITDDPARFAEHCVRLLRDARLRLSMARAAQRVLSSRYRLDLAKQRITDTVGAVLNAATQKSAGSAVRPSLTVRPSLADQPAGRRPR